MLDPARIVTGGVARIFNFYPAGICINSHVLEPDNYDKKYES